MRTMLNLHKLLPCACCPVRMAVPGSLICTTCAATDAAMVVPDTIAEVVHQ